MDTFFAIALIAQISTGVVKAQVDMQHPYKTYEECVESLGARFEQVERIVTEDITVALGCMPRKEHKA